MSEVPLQRERNRLHAVKDVRTENGSGQGLDWRIRSKFARRRLAGQGVRCRIQDPSQQVSGVSTRPADSGLGSRFRVLGVRRSGVWGKSGFGYEGRDGDDPRMLGDQALPLILLLLHYCQT